MEIDNQRLQNGMYEETVKPQLWQTPLLNTVASVTQQKMRQAFVIKLKD